MLAALRQYEQIPDDEALLARGRHVLVVLPAGRALAGPALETLKSVLERRKLKPEELAKTPVSASLANGALCAWVKFDPSRSAFEQGTALRKALAALLEESPAEVTIAVYDRDPRAAAIAADAAWVNGAALPARKKKAA